MSGLSRHVRDNCEVEGCHRERGLRRLRCVEHDDVLRRIADEAEGLEDVPEISPATQARFDGGAAFETGVKIEAAPKKYADEWRSGWKQMRSWKMAAFEDYIKQRTLFDKAYVPPGMRGERGFVEMVQKRRKKAMERHVARWPDIPAAYDKYLTWKAGE